MFEPMVVELNGFGVAGLSRVELGLVTAGIGRVRAALDGLEVRVAVAVDDLGDGGVGAEDVTRERGRVSEREAARRARRARQLRDMPNTRRRLERGELTGEHVDELVKAAEQTSAGDVDDDAGLLDLVGGRPADVAGRDVRDWVRRRQAVSDREARHRRQREGRSLVLFRGDDDMAVALCRSDVVTGEQFRARVDAMAQRLYRHDGGRDGRDGVKARSWEQLRHDALMTLLGITTNTDTSPSPNNTTGTGSAGSAGSAGAGGLGGSVGSQIVVVVDADVVSGADTGGRCEIAGVGPLPVSVLERLACDAEIFGHVFGADGVSLWHGRATRTVSPQQRRALLARDRGCVLCGAHPDYCEAHHVIEWAVGGGTDIENLALLCTRHHHQLHDTNQILIRAGPDQPNRWHTQPRAGPRTRTKPRDRATPRSAAA